MGEKGKWAQLPYFSERKNTRLGFIHPFKSQPKPMNYNRMYLCDLINKGFRVLDRHQDAQVLVCGTARFKTSLCS